MRRALTWVLDNKNDDGGIPIVARGDHSVVDATAQTLLCSVAADRARSDEFFSTSARALAEWLVNHQLGNGGWKWRAAPDMEWTASTAFALIALNSFCREFETEVADTHSAVDLGLRWLSSMRNTDGGWGGRKGADSHPAITGLVMYSLAALGLRTLAAESVDYLRATQDDNGSWPSAIDRPTGHSIIRFGTAYAMAGLASCETISCTALERGLKALIKSFRINHFEYEDTGLQTWPTRDGVLALWTVRESILGN